MRVNRSLAGALLLSVLFLVTPATAVAQPELSPNSASLASTSGISSGVASGWVAQEDSPAPGPRIDPEDSAEADSQQAQRKFVVGIIAAALLAIVIYGRYVRHKRRKSG
ncbi:hypothetical protein EV191_101140 [Tamaricihabitans halophyticus]|uniref:MYXO-CTERM domain-containing protein n=1 Tax=Tamaricihabitans halophyticus TaxID=1262583 RepID=A0A4R2R0N5_9PSEU|nr:hypothetical protein [Tamaricihabitans halophyticus]TCP56200.1 hypothetical protein EV191_101140 [Tamaricihabitans halophyticus]